MRQNRKRIIKIAAGEGKSSFLLVLLMLFLISCGNDKLVESYTTIPENSWGESDIQKFAFEVTDTTVSYDLLFTIKNSMEYPFYNLYLDYQLVRLGDEAESVQRKELKEFILFDSRSGKPFGRGSSGLYDHEFKLEENFRFDRSGTYEVRYQQYMRRESLAGVASVGFALATFKAEE